MVALKELGEQVGSTWSLVGDLCCVGCMFRQSKSNASFDCPNRRVPVGLSRIVQCELLSEAVHDIFTEWPSVPTCEDTAVDRLPASRGILISSDSLDYLMLVILWTLSVVGHEVIENTRSMIELGPLTISLFSNRIFQVFRTHVHVGVVIFSLHFLRAL